MEREALLALHTESVLAQWGGKGRKVLRKALVDCNGRNVASAELCELTMKVDALVEPYLRKHHPDAPLEGAESMAWAVIMVSRGALLVHTAGCE